MEGPAPEETLRGHRAVTRAESERAEWRRRTAVRTAEAPPLAFQNTSAQAPGSPPSTSTLTNKRVQGDITLRRCFFFKQFTFIIGNNKKIL